MKANHFKQTKPYGCGIYSIANIFQDEAMIKAERLEESKNGNNVGQLSKWLQEDGHELFLEPFYFTCTGDKLPKEICELKPYGEDVISMPVMIDVQFSEEGKMHFIAGEIMADGTVLIIDSLKDELEITTLEELNTKYYRVFGLWYLRDLKTGNYYMRFKP